MTKLQRNARGEGEAEKILILTLSLTSAVEQNRLDEIEPLLRERERAIAQLVKTGTLSIERQKQILEAELRFTQLCESEKVLAVAALERTHVGKRASKAYSGSSRAAFSAFHQES